MEKKECFEYLKNEGNSNILMEKAFLQKKAVYGDKVFIRGIIEFSNFCRKNCLYCGIRRDNDNLPRYRMDINDILERVNIIVNYDIKTVVLQAGEDLFYTRELLCKIIKEIKKKHDIAITLCIGERDIDDYKAFFDAGADRFLMKHETSNEKVYEKLHPGETLKGRLKLIEALKKIGFQVGSGNIIGLPFTKLEDYINDIFLIRDLDLDMAGIGPFMPTKNTPLEGYQSPDIDLVFKILAIARIVLKDVNIPATTALFSLGGISALESAIDAGANVFMPNFTGESLRKNYRIYDNKSPINMEIIKNIAEKRGLKIVKSKGERRKVYAKNNESRKEKSHLCWAS
ncbi:MAG: [FeFe] hydrogenase H-cluster radical SAM maturase HydE [Proteobacteria bacterium]|nr:[FeFe] hydrogenase H-cluster radical SAM maturase HydE [Pseudomonadota bacterium]